MAARKVLKSVNIVRTGGDGDGRKEQISLAPGSAEYMEYQRDLAGIDEERFVQRADGQVDPGLEKTPDEIQDAPAEPEHVAKLAEQVRERNETQQQQAEAVQLQKTIRKMAKITGFHAVKKAAVAIAAATPEKEDDIAARKARVDSIPDVVYDDGVTQRNYTQEALEDMGFEP